MEMIEIDGGGGDDDDDDEIRERTMDRVIGLCTAPRANVLLAGLFVRVRLVHLGLNYHAWMKIKRLCLPPWLCLRVLESWVVEVEVERDNVRRRRSNVGGFVVA